MYLPTAPHQIFFKFSLAVLLACMIPQVQAGASNKNGSPYGNGTFFQTTGTFSAVVRGENLSGTMLFSTGVSTNTADTNSSGTTTISYLGSSDGFSRAGMYIGNATGMWDPSSGAISGQIWGGQNISGSNSVTVYPEMYNQPLFPAPITTVSAAGVTNTIYVQPVGSNSFNNTAYMSGNFSGSTQNKYPNQTFTAQGTLVQQQLYPQIVDTSEGTVPVQMAGDLQIPITVQGIRVSETYSSFNTISNSVPYSTTTYTMTNFATF
jgi:hypothetical protein